MKRRIPASCRCVALLVAAATLSMGVVGCAAHRESALARRVAAGDARAQYARGITLLITEDGRLYRPDEAYPLLLAAAEQGLPNAQALVGMCLQHGWGVKPDDKAAREWYQKAIMRGQSGAAMQMAVLFADTPKEAAHWLELALSRGRGTPDAQLMLASLYLRQKEYHKAVQFLRFAALDGSGEGAYLMASCYEMGVGVPKDERLMMGWLQNAADMGYKPAKVRLKELKKLASEAQKNTPGS